jgi:3-oxoacyl-[acyl-carrier protein] reductase
MSQPVAFITGATRGIGRALAFAFGQAGYQVGVCARGEEDVRGLVDELGRAGFPAAGHPADVGVPDDVKAAVRQVTGQLGPVDVLINNAGIGVLKPLVELTLDDWDRTMSTNLRSLYLVTRAVLPSMLERGQGIIVNIASLAGKNALVGGTAYAASKHAVLGFSKSLMLEVRKQGVRVVAVCPGTVHTEFGSERTVPKISREGTLLPEDVAQVVLDAVRLPSRALASEIDLRPANPS